MLDISRGIGGDVCLMLAPNDSIEIEDKAFDGNKQVFLDDQPNQTEKGVVQGVAAYPTHGWQLSIPSNSTIPVVVRTHEIWGFQNGAPTFFCPRLFRIFDKNIISHPPTLYEYTYTWTHIRTYVREHTHPWLIMTCVGIRISYGCSSI